VWMPGSRKRTSVPIRQPSLKGKNVGASRGRSSRASEGRWAHAGGMEEKNACPQSLRIPPQVQGCGGDTSADEPWTLRNSSTAGKVRALTLSEGCVGRRIIRPPMPDCWGERRNELGFGRTLRGLDRKVGTGGKPGRSLRAASGGRGLHKKKRCVRGWRSGQSNQEGLRLGNPGEQGPHSKSRGPNGQKKKDVCAAVHGGQNPFEKEPLLGVKLKPGQPWEKKEAKVEKKADLGGGPLAGEKSFRGGRSCPKKKRVSRNESSVVCQKKRWDQRAGTFQRPRRGPEKGAVGKTDAKKARLIL